MNSLKKIVIFVSVAGVLSLVFGCSGQEKASGEVKSEGTPAGAGSAGISSTTPNGGSGQTQAAKPTAQ